MTFAYKMTVSGELCCVALPFCCVVVVALPFSASLEGLFIYIGRLHLDIYTVQFAVCDTNWTAL